MQRQAEQEVSYARSKSPRPLSCYRVDGSTAARIDLCIGRCVRASSQMTASAVTQTLDPRLQHPRIQVSVSETALAGC